MCSLCINAFAHDSYENSTDVFVTPEMAEKDRAEIEKMIEQGQAIRDSYSNKNRSKRSTTRKTLSVPQLYQDSPKWGDKLFPCGHTTYAQSGCAMTSYAMVSRRYGNSSETPVTFAEKYYKSYGDPCKQLASNAAKLMGKRAVTGKKPSRTEIENVAINAIDKGYPIVIRTNKWGSHYIVAYGYYITSSGNATIYIRDPEGDYRAESLGTYYNSGAIVREYAIIK